ncbi:MAG: cation transporting ATPase C-terminal domain-containing protein, partial [Pseudoxanthomonas sp.]
DLSRFLLHRAHGGNRWLPRMFGGVTVMLLLVIGVPFFRKVMGLSIPDATTLGYAALMLAAAMVWLEALRRATRRFSPIAASPT